MQVVVVSPTCWSITDFLVCIDLPPLPSLSPCRGQRAVYSDLDTVMTRTGGLTIVMGDFNAALGEGVQGLVGNHGLDRQTSDSGERLMSFASGNGLNIVNTLFSHKQIHQTSWYPQIPEHT